MQSLVLPTDPKDIPEEPYPTNGREAWERLRAGNERFASGDLVGFLANLATEINPQARMSLTSSQNPFAVVVTCADSRVAPELLFDEGLGLLFVIRMAGNVIDKASLGSIDYAVQHLKPSLLLVMGHQSCGAVKAAVESHGVASQDNIGTIISKIFPAVEKAKNVCGPHESDAGVLNKAVEENVLATAREIVEHSTVVEEHLAEGSLTIITSVYYLDSGRVLEVKGQPPPPEHPFHSHHQHRHLSFW